MLTFFKHQFRKHYRVTIVRNSYGDEIIEWGWRRYLWKYAKCGALVPDGHLHHSGEMKC